jgi:hypothetical protein
MDWLAIQSATRACRGCRPNRSYQGREQVSEPEHPGFTILPFLDKSFKDGVAYGVMQERARIIELLLDGWVRNENAPIIQAINGEKVSNEH